MVTEHNDLSWELQNTLQCSLGFNFHVNGLVVGIIDIFLWLHFTVSIWNTYEAQALSACIRALRHAPFVHPAATSTLYGMISYQITKLVTEKKSDTWYFGLKALFILQKLMLQILQKPMLQTLLFKAFCTLRTCIFATDQTLFLLFLLLFSCYFHLIPLLHTVFFLFCLFFSSHSFYPFSPRIMRLKPLGLKIN